MTTMIAEVYDALVAAGSPEAKARSAAEAIAAYENRFTGIEQRLTRIEGEINVLVVGMRHGPDRGVVLDPELQAACPRGALE